jgi:putative DNA primase/helicase
MDNHIDSDRFSALSHAERAVAGPANGAPHMKRGNSGVLVSPVPADAPGLPVAHHKYGKATGSWAYRDTTGAILFWVLRFDPPGERKQFFPLSLWRVEGRLKWRWQGVPAPRPLYAMDKLAQRLEVSVVICEGEKSADAAAMIFPSVATCSPNGSGSAKNADWSPLEGRRALVWPDADRSGDEYTSDVTHLLQEIGCEVSVIDARALAAVRHDGGKRELEDGWDAADAIEQWEDLESLRKAAASHTNSFAAQQGVANAEFGREIQRLAKLSVIEYERERIAASKKLNIRALVLDMLVKAARPSSDEPAHQGKAASLN